MAGSVIGARNTELVYLSRSPDYCKADDQHGILGTKVHYLVCIKTVFLKTYYIIYIFVIVSLILI